MKNKINRSNLLMALVAALFCVAVASVIFTPTVSGSTQQAATPAEKTVEQVQKNIKVLTGMPQSQLIPAMNFMSASLGVRCNFCHVNKDGKWDFVSDEKPEKNTAREMIQMVLAVNKNTFKGNTEVSCYTCHQGKIHPVSSPALPLPEATPRPTAEAKPADTKPSETGPTAEQVLTKYAEALGGAAAVDKIKTRTMKGTFTTSSGATFGYDVMQSAPDRVYVVLTTPQGVSERGFDGNTGWEKTARGIRPLGDEELAGLRRVIGLFRNVNLSKQFSRVTFAGKDKIGDRDVYVLRGTTVDNRRERLYFDAQTGLLLRRITSTTTMIGVIPEQVDFEDYRNVDGVMMPFTVRVSSVDPNISATRKYTEIKLNAPIDETKFNQPKPAPVNTPTP